MQSILNNPKYGPRSELGTNMFTYLKFGLPRVLPPDKEQVRRGGVRYTLRYGLALYCGYAARCNSDAIKKVCHFRRFKFLKNVLWEIFMMHNLIDLQTLSKLLPNLFVKPDKYLPKQNIYQNLFKHLRNLCQTVDQLFFKSLTKLQTFFRPSPNL